MRYVPVDVVQHVERDNLLRKQVMTNFLDELNDRLEGVDVRLSRALEGHDPLCAVVLLDPRQLLLAQSQTVLVYFPEEYREYLAGGHPDSSGVDFLGAAAAHGHQLTEHIAPFDPQTLLRSPRDSVQEP